VPGKLRGDDIIEGKKSLPIILHLRRRPEDRERVRDCFVAAAADPAAASGPIAELVARLESSGSLADARRQAEQLLGEAEATLQRGFPPSGGRQQLLELVSSLVRS
jgi:octaprenyl-diphosphate synthase